MPTEKGPDRSWATDPKLQGEYPPKCALTGHDQPTLKTKANTH